VDGTRTSKVCGVHMKAECWGAKLKCSEVGDMEKTKRADRGGDVPLGRLDP